MMDFDDLIQPLWHILRNFWFWTVCITHHASSISVVCGGTCFCSLPLEHRPQVASGAAHFCRRRLMSLSCAQQDSALKLSPECLHSLPPCSHFSAALMLQPGYRKAPEGWRIHRGQQEKLWLFWGSPRANSTTGLPQERVWAKRVTGRCKEIPSSACDGCKLFIYYCKRSVQAYIQSRCSCPSVAYLHMQTPIDRKSGPRDAEACQSVPKATIRCFTIFVFLLLLSVLFFPSQ